MAGFIERAWNAVVGAVPKHPDAKGSRYDFLENSYLGYGTSRDKLAFGTFGVNATLTERELQALYYHDDVGARIVNQRPAEMLRRGYRLCSKKTPDRATTLQKQGEALGVDGHVLRGMQWGRWQGGAVTIMGALDGSDNLASPLNEKAVREVKYLSTVDRRLVSVDKWQDVPFKPGYGEPEVYTVGSLTSGVSRVHVSRLVRFDGVKETDPITRRSLGGWTHSALQRPYEVVRAFATSFKSVEHLISDASQGVWKIQGLLDLLTSNREELLTRLQFSDMTRSAGRAIMLDSEGESFERQPTSFTGVREVIELFMMRLASASNTPVTILMGRSPAGMNATGDSDFRAWYGDIATEQVNELKPVLLRAYRLIGGPDVPDDLDVEFAPLWEPTEQEKATTAKTIAETDKIYFDMGAALAGQVAIARFGSGEGKIEIDEDAIRAELDHELELMKDPAKKAEQQALVQQAMDPAGDEGEGEGDAEEKAGGEQG